MTYASALHLIRGARNLTRRKVGNNTWGEIHPDGTITFTLHATPVVTLNPDGSAILRTNGWRTTTTKARINKYSPVRVYQQRRAWFTYRPGTLAVPFTEGMTVWG